MQVFFLVALGGAIGSAARYGVTLVSEHFLGTGFPWQTMIVNVLGSFFMGFVTGLAASRHEFSPAVQTFITVGVLGGFTTFSSFSLDFMKLLDAHQTAMALAYVAGSLIVSFLMLYAGLMLARTLAA